MAGVKGKSGRKPSKNSKREAIHIRLSKAQKELLQEMAETTQAGTVSAVIHELIDTQSRIKNNQKASGASDVWQK